MALGVKQMREAANAAVPKITPAEAREKIAKGNALLLDIRDGTEVQASGKAAGAVHVSRGLLEFRADPDAPTHDKNFARDKTILIYCASGGRAALAGKLLKDMGYNEVYNIGGFKDWAESGGAVEKERALNLFPLSPQGGRGGSAFVGVAVEAFSTARAADGPAAPLRESTGPGSRGTEFALSAHNRPSGTDR